MNGWLVRGLGMTLVHVISRIVLAYLIADNPLAGSPLRTSTLLIVIAVAAIWGGVDGLRDRRANPDPDDSADLTMLWLKASVVAGLGSGLITWIVSLFSPVPITSNSIFFEITSGAAFTILLVFVPAVLAAGLGRLIAGREQRKNGLELPVRRRTKTRDAGPAHLDDAATETVSMAKGGRHQAAADTDPDTEVFAAIPSDADPATWTEPRDR